MSFSTVYRPMGALLLVAILPAIMAVPKKYDGGFLPSPVSYYQQNGDQLAMESTGQNDAPSPATPAPAPNAGSPSPRSADQDSAVSADTRPQEPRFGFIGYAPNAVQDPHYAGTAAGQYGALRLDLGGVLLGALIGLGASLVLPKLLHAGPHGHDGYKRSETGAEGDGLTSTLSHILSRMDTALAEQNIDSTSCIQRAVCSYVQASAARTATGDATSVESFIDSATRNTLMGYMLEGSSFKQAVDTGRKGGNCEKVFYKCPFNKDTVAAGIKSVISVVT